MFEWLGMGLTGGLSGILGAGVTAVVGYFKTKAANAHDLAVRDQEYKMAQLEGENAARSGALALESVAVEAAGAARVASYGPMTKLSGATSPWVQNILGIVDAVRGLMRPAITLYALIAVSFMPKVVEFGHEMSGSAEAMIYVASTAVSWWFADRGFGKYQKVTGR